MSSTSLITPHGEPTRLGPIQNRRRHLLRVIGVFTLPLLFVCDSRWSDGGNMHPLIETLGIALILICIAGRSICALYIGGRKCSELVTSGPYSVTRNPLYFFSLLGAMGAGMQGGSLFIGLLAGLCFWAIFDRLIRREEQFLVDYFPEYSQYRATTPRWIPSMRLWNSPKQLTVEPARVFRTLRDSSFFLLSIPVFDSIEWLHAHGVSAALFRVY